MPGYVGYISDGGFHFLFDAGTESGSGEHNADLPPDFERLEVGPIKRRTRLPGCLHTATIRRIGTDGGDPPSILGCVCTFPGWFVAVPLIYHHRPMEPGANMNFELAGRQGVALITDHMTYREDIERRGKADSHAKKYFDSWVNFAREKGHGDDAKPIFVTGVDLTKRFALIAYPDIENSLRCKFSVGAPGSAALPVWGTWDADGLIHKNSGQSFVDRGTQSQSTNSSSQLVAPSRSRSMCFRPLQHNP